MSTPRTPFDVTFLSANSESYPKRITAFVVVPDRIDAATGLLHCSHGWGGNRFQYVELMIPCIENELVLDWSLEPSDPGLMRWVSRD